MAETKLTKKPLALLARAADNWTPMPRNMWINLLLNRGLVEERRLPGKVVLRDRNGEPFLRETNFEWRITPAGRKALSGDPQVK